MNKVIAATCLVLGLTWLATGSVAHANECIDQPELELCHSSFSFLLDNDTLLLKSYRNEDRNYTMGLAFQWSGRWIHERGLTKPLNWVSRLLPDKLIAPEAGFSTFHSFRFGNVAFTPDRLNTRRLIPNDRPYASLLAFDVSSHNVSQDDRHARATELSVGLLGLSISERFQRWLHRKMQDSPDEPPFPPEGWGNQVSDGGELTARYTFRWQHELLSRALKDHADLQVIAEGNVGYHTNVGTGAALRVGRIVSPWWQFTMAPIPQGVGVAGKSPGAGCRGVTTSRYELYGWTGFMGRAWGYNVLLQGQFRDSAVTVPSERMERFVYDYGAGITGGLCLGHHWHRLNLTYSRRSPEFDGLLRRYHSWGGIYYSIAIEP